MSTPTDWPIQGKMHFRLFHDRLGRLDLSCDNGYVVTAYDLGFPEIREVSVNNSLDDGTFDVTRFYGARSVSLDVVLKPYSGVNTTSRFVASESRLRDKLLAYTYPGIRSVLVFSEHQDDRIRQILIRAAEASYAVEQAHYNKLSVSWVAPRGNLLSWDQRCYPYTFSSNTPDTMTKTILNDGNVPANWIATLTGEAVRPRFILNGEDVLQLDYVSQPGDSIVIESFSRTVTVNGQAVGYKYISDNSEWFQIPPGESALTIEHDTYTIQGFPFAYWQGRSGAFSDAFDRPDGLLGNGWVQTAARPAGNVAVPTTLLNRSAVTSPDLSGAPVPGAILVEPFNNLTSWAVGNATIIPGGRTGSGAQIVGAGSLIYTVPTASRDPRMIVGAAVRLSVLTATPQPILTYGGDGNSVTHLTMRVNTDGSIAVLRGPNATGTVLATSAAGLIAANTWAYIEMAATLHDTAGAVTVRVNNNAVITLNGVDTRNAGTSAMFDALVLSGTQGAVASQFDDLYLRTGTNAVFGGDVHIGAGPSRGYVRQTNQLPDGGQYIEIEIDDVHQWPTEPAGAPLTDSSLEIYARMASGDVAAGPLSCMVLGLDLDVPSRAVNWSVYAYNDDGTKVAPYKSGTFLFAGPLTSARVRFQSAADGMQTIWFNSLFVDSVAVASPKTGRYSGFSLAWQQLATVAPLGTSPRVTYFEAGAWPRLNAAPGTFAYLRPTSTAWVVANQPPLRITTDINLDYQGTIAGLANVQSLMTLDGGAGLMAFRYRFTPGTAAGLHFEWSVDGNNWLNTAMALLTPAELSALGPGDMWLRMSLQRNVAANSVIQMFTSPDGTTWTPYGTQKLGPVMADTFDVPTVPLRIGNVPGGAVPWLGKVYSLRLLNRTSSAVLWRFNAADYPGTGLSYVDPRGRTWTQTVSGAIIPVTPSPPAPQPAPDITNWAIPPGSAPPNNPSPLGRPPWAWTTQVDPGTGDPGRIQVQFCYFDTYI
jgi:Siphovirus-type tail component, C-terminal domain